MTSQQITTIQDAAVAEGNFRLSRICLTARGACPRAIEFSGIDQYELFEEHAIKVLKRMSSIGLDAAIVECAAHKLPRVR